MRQIIRNAIRCKHCGDEIHMYPLSFAEFMSVYQGDKYMGLSEYMLYGGIPPVVLREDVSDKAAALQNLFSEIYIRDICKRNKIRNILTVNVYDFLLNPDCLEK